MSDLAQRLRRRRENVQGLLRSVEKEGLNPAVLKHYAENPEGLTDKDRRRIELALRLPYLHCGTPDPPPELDERLSDVHVLRILRSNPGKIDEMLRLESLICDASYILANCCSSKADAAELAMAYVTESKQARLKLLIEDVNDRISLLQSLRDKEVRVELRNQRRSEVAAAQFAGIAEDLQLAGALWQALDNAAPAVGYVYLKRWRMPDNSCWFKIGITNNPSRREAQQNVLPVAAETIVCVDVGSMDRARSVEAVVHQVLEEQRITDANNRELFHLSDQQAAAVKAVLEKLV
ncbi:GIY-YIG nuclease family protein [Cyanobium sp. FGCU-6]|nr:GIY-YIG nuclease family protein [Cyanobium sp. FGCU6]